MATPIKIRDMFLVPPGGGRVVLNPGAQYAMTRQGVVTTAPELPALPELEAGRPEALRAYNTNAFVALGSRGDLRQLEAMYGNVTNLYNNAVLESDAFYGGNLANELERFEQVAPSGHVYGNPDADTDLLSVSGEWGTGMRSYVVQGGSTATGPWTTLSSVLKTHSVTAAYETTFGAPVRYKYYRVTNGTYIFPLSLKLTLGRPKARSSKFLTRAESARIAELIADPYNAHIFIEGGVPVGEDILTLMIPSPVSLPANLAGSYLHCGTKPSAAFAITLYKNATSLGTLTINTSGGFAASITATSFAKGDKLRLVPQTVGDATLADLALTLHMKRG